MTSQDYVIILLPVPQNSQKGYYCRNPTVSVKAGVSVNSNPNPTSAVNFRTNTTCQHKYAVMDQRS